MLRATIEIVPFGDEDTKRTIGTLQIALQYSLGHNGFYRSELETDGFVEPETPQVFIEHDRRLGAFVLVERALELHRIGQDDHEYKPAPQLCGICHKPLEGNEHPNAFVTHNACSMEATKHLREENKGMN